MSKNLRNQIFNNLNLKETDELVDIWIINDRVEWSDTAFDVIQEILEQRLDEFPVQNEPIFEHKKQEDEKIVDEMAGKESPIFLPAIIVIIVVIVVIIFCAIYFGPAIVITAIMNTTSYPKSYDLSKQVPSWEKQGATTQVSECALPILDGGDGLDTTGCGTLKIGVFATGTTSSTLEAHNWQFSAQKGNSITIANDGKTCVKISILDSSDNVIEKKSFTCQKRTETTISFTNFYPPTNGTYILRLTTPVSPGKYWLKID